MGYKTADLQLGGQPGQDREQNGTQPYADDSGLESDGTSQHSNTHVFEEEDPKAELTDNSSEKARQHMTKFEMEQDRFKMKMEAQMNIMEQRNKAKFEELQTKLKAEVNGEL